MRNGKPLAAAAQVYTVRRRRYVQIAVCLLEYLRVAEGCMPLIKRAVMELVACIIYFTRDRE